MKSASGFTVVELVVVLLLLGIVAAVGGPRFFDMQSYRMRGWIDQLLVTTSYARSQAIANRSQKVRLVLDVGSLRAELAADCSTATTTALANPAGNGNLAFTAPAGVSLAVTGQTLPFTVCFDSVGRPRDNASAAGSPLGAVTILQVTGGSTTTPLFLERESGFIHL